MYQQADQNHYLTSETLVNEIKKQNKFVFDEIGIVRDRVIDLEKKLMILDNLSLDEINRTGLYVENIQKMVVALRDLVRDILGNYTKIRQEKGDYNFHEFMISVLSKIDAGLIVVENEKRNIAERIQSINQNFIKLKGDKR